MINTEVSIPKQRYKTDTECNFWVKTQMQLSQQKLLYNRTKGQLNAMGLS